MTRPTTHLLQVTPSYWPQTGGVETHLAELNQIFTHRGYDVQVLTLTDQTTLPHQETHQGITIHRGLIPLHRFWPKFQHKMEVWRAINHHVKLLTAADIIHVHDVFWWILPLLPFIWYKTYVTFHGWEGQYPVRWQAKLQRWLWSILARKTIHVGKWIAEFYWDSPDAVTYGGITLPKRRSRPARATATPPQLVFLGRLDEANDLQLYLQLVKLLRQKLPTLTVTWVGDGSYHAECAQLGKVTGMIADPIPQLTPATVVLAASYLSILTAQSLGKVVGALYSQPLKQRYLETYPGVQYMIMNRNPRQLATKILPLLTNPTRRRQLERAARIWASTQTWAQVADVYEQVWESA